MSAVKHQPATPLPWEAAKKSPDYDPLRSASAREGMLGYTTSDDGIHFKVEDLAYVAHAANAYPKLVNEVALLRRALHIANQMLTGRRRKERAEIACFAGRLLETDHLLRTLEEAS